jgi:DNA-binding NarL/FixJ family response regulator
MNIVIVEGDPKAVGVLRQYLEGSEFQITGVFSSGEEALDGIPSLSGSPDIVLMDTHLPGISGIETTRLLKERHSGLEIIVQNVSDDSRTIMEAIKAGASGFLIKGFPGEALLSSLLEVRKGGSFLTGRVARMVLEEIQEPRGKGYGLTDREEEILRELVQGASYKKIADRLGLSVHTVNNHIRKIYEKMQVHSRGEAVAKLTRH